MTLVEKYENLIQKIKSHQMEFKSELSELILKENLTKDEVDYMHHLMDWVKSGDMRISLSSYELRDLKDN